ncbi:hypothetical protein B0H66DRAFT_536729 [Apodospora peruviana]|uniref:Uncharacterized protein n=1 Tax=Apodospora peruviana TaxID=516989 RepID=A0AAE0HV41_9PEZI|nr:hypothetical protein B0H66DRAFT_536729 [Apodospora peruviana]
MGGWDVLRSWAPWQPSTCQVHALVSCSLAVYPQRPIAPRSHKQINSHISPTQLDPWSGPGRGRVEITGEHHRRLRWSPQGRSALILTYLSGVEAEGTHTRGFRGSVDQRCPQTAFTVDPGKMKTWDTRIMLSGYAIAGCDRPASCER